MGRVKPTVAVEEATVCARLDMLVSGLFFANGGLDMSVGGLFFADGGLDMLVGRLFFADGWKWEVGDLSLCVSFVWKHHLRRLTV